MPDCRYGPIRGQVCRELDVIIERHGKPLLCVSDNGTGLISAAVLGWTQEHHIDWHYIAPGQPTDNAFVESFNGSFRAECLNAYWFLSLEDAQSKCEAWRQDYNTVRPHSAIGHRPPIVLANASGQARLP